MYVYVCREKKRDEKQGVVFTVLPKRIKNSIYIYIYIKRQRERERERERNKKRERRGEKEAPPPETAGESQKNNDSDGVSESENKRQEKTLKVMCFTDSKKNDAERIFLTLIASHSRTCGHTSCR